MVKTFLENSGYKRLYFVKKYIIIILGVLIFICGLIILIKKENLQNKKNSLQIIDATYSCQSVKEKFYEDDNYVYYFPCVKSKSIYVKFENGNKMLITEALQNNKVTIDELLKNGLDAIREEK